VSAEVLDMENLVKVCKNLKAQRDTAVSKRPSSLDAHEKKMAWQQAAEQYSI
jgi:hypothetical protein